MIASYLASRSADLVALRRTLHRDPEVGLHTPRTQQAVLDALAGLDLEITLGESLTSVVAVLRGGRRPDADAPVVLLRGDMDGLPVREATGLDFAADTGTMHACGHDLHTSMLIGAAWALHAMRSELAGDVVFMFQPGEESLNGAGHMIAEGVLDAAGRRADAAYALHVFAAGPAAGVFSTRAGTVMAASNRAYVTVRGKGGHGSSPHLAVDPVPAMAEMITATQVLIGREFDAFDPVIITVGEVRAGTASNVIADEAYFAASMRTFSDAATEQLFERLPRTLDALAAAHGCTVDAEYVRLYPPTINDAVEARFALDTLADLFGVERAQELEHSMPASEDFSRVLAEVPGAFIALSASISDDPDLPFNHAPDAQFDDSVLVDGATALAELARRRLARG